MEPDKLKYQIGNNIAAYRKRGNMTQAGLAEKLNYSDKAVSKWERGESVPDVMTLVQLAELFGVTVNDLLVDPNALPEKPGVVSSVVKKALKRRRADKGIILMLCSILVFFVALLVFVVLSSVGIPKSWVAFVYAIPITAIVLLSLRSAWHDFRWNRGLISTIVWGSLLSIYVSLLLFARENVWKLFLLGIPGQAAIFLWFRMFRTVKTEDESGKE